MRVGPFLVLLLAGMFIMSTGAAFADQNSDEIKMLRSQAVEAHVRGDFQRALDYYGKALQTAKGAYGDNAPFLAEIYYDMGSMCLSFSDFNKAETYLKETLRLNPNSTTARLRLAELLRLQNRPDEAAKQVGVVLAKHREDVVAHHELALAYDANQDNLRAYKEYSTLDQLVQHERDIAEGKFVPVKFTMPFFTKPAAVPKAPVVKTPDDQDKKAAEAAKKKADADAKKAAEEAKKKAVQDKKKADLDKKKSDQDKKKSDQEKKKAADKKAAEDKKKADQEKKAIEARKKAEQASKNASVKPAEESDNLTGLPAKLRSKAVLLTPVGKKKPASAESSSTTTAPAPKKPAPVKPPAEEDAASSSGGEADEPEAKAPPPKKIKPAELKPMVPKSEPVVAKPKAGKHAAGLVPPPPPLVPTYQPMALPPQPVAPAPKPKPPAPKKVEEKPKEQPAAGGSDKPEDEDWLLDFAGTKPKGKKK